LKIQPVAVGGVEPTLVILRNPKYKGPSGEKIWQIDCAECNKDAKAFKQHKAKALSRMMETLSTEVIEKMGAKMINPSYEEAFRSAELLSMWNGMKQVTVGAGDQSFNVDLKDLITMKMKDNNWGSFIDKWRRNKMKIEQRKLSDREFRQLFYDTALIASIAENPLFALEINEIFKSPNWPDHETLMAQITSRMAFLDQARKSTGSHGAISANKVTTRDGARDDMIMAFRADISKMICFNCGELGHGSRFCKKIKSVCSVCSRNHLSKLHKIVEDQEAKSKAKASTCVRKPAKALHTITDDMLNESDWEASYSHHSAMNLNLKSAGDDNIDAYLTSIVTSQQEDNSMDEESLIKDIQGMYATVDEEEPIHAWVAMIEHDVDVINDDWVLNADVNIKDTPDYVSSAVTPDHVFSNMLQKIRTFNVDTMISNYASKQSMRMKRRHRVLMNQLLPPLCN
jgi:hypothetical protein